MPTLPTNPHYVGDSGHVNDHNTIVTALSSAAYLSSGNIVDQSGSTTYRFGKLLQMVRDTDSTQRSTSSTTYADITGMSVTITPIYSTSNILVIATGFYDVRNASNNNIAATLQITTSSNTAVSGAEAVALGTINLTRSGTGVFQTSAVLIGYASPATTSATTYKLRWKVEDASATAYLYNQTVTGQLFAIEIGA